MNKKIREEFQNLLEHMIKQKDQEGLKCVEDLKDYIDKNFCTIPMKVMENAIWQRKENRTYFGYKSSVITSVTFENKQEFLENVSEEEINDVKKYLKHRFIEMLEENNEMS